MFKGVSQCIPTVTLLWSVQALPLLSLTPLPPIPHCSTPFYTHAYILYLYRCYVLWFYWCSIILFYFPSFPNFHRLVPLLQICSTYGFVYDHACFHIYVYLLALSSIWKKTCGLCLFVPGLLSLNMRSSNCTHLPSNHIIIHYFMVEQNSII
jgi:hypothetical protein